MEGEQVFETIIAGLGAFILGAVFLVFSILFDRRMKKHNRENVTNILRNERKLELREIRAEIDQLSQIARDKQLTKNVTNGVE